MLLNAHVDLNIFIQIAWKDVGKKQAQRRLDISQKKPYNLLLFVYNYEKICPELFFKSICGWTPIGWNLTSNILGYSFWDATAKNSKQAILSRYWSINDHLA